MKTAVMGIALCLGVACTGGKQGRVATDGTEPQALQVVRGELVMGHEASSFRADGDTLDYWVDDRTGRLDSLYKAVVGEGAVPYAPVHAVLKVRHVERAAEGFAADYAGTYEVDEIVELAPMDASVCR